MTEPEIIGKDRLGPVAEASTRQWCNTVYPGSIPGRASNLRSLRQSLLTSISVGQFAFGKQLQPSGVARGGCEHGIDQARKARIDILAAQLHQPVGADNARQHQSGFAQLGEVVGQIRLAAELVEIAATQLG